MKKLFLLLLLSLSFKNYACSCDEKATIKQAYYNANEVFTGKIISVDSSHFDTTGRKIYLFDILIIHTFKTDTRKKQGEMRTLFFRNTPGLCDFQFILNKEYLIYEAKEKIHYDHIIHYASGCSRTSLLSNVKQEELDKLTYLSKTGISDDDPEVEHIFGLTSEEYEELKAQANKCKTIETKDLHIMILYGIILITAITFFFLYIKVKKKLKAVSIPRSQ